MRVARLITLSLVLHTVACGGSSARRDTRTDAPDAGEGGSGAVDSGAGHVCADPESSVPDVTPFVPPPLNGLGTFQVTFQNRCATTVWPAWGKSGGLENSVIDTQIWFPLLPGSDRNVTVYGGLRQIGFWGRTGCSFDEQGLGSCQTGDCGRFVCLGVFPANATVFDLERGFLGEYNLGLRVDGVACGNHACVADLAACAPASAVEDSCGGTIACRDVCSDAAPECCRAAESRCNKEQVDDTDHDDLVMTFCP